MAADPIQAALAAAEADVQHLLEERARRRADIPEDAPLWLALAPLWTAELARECELPSGDLGPARVLERLEDEGLCERTQIRPPPRVEDGTFVRSRPVVCFRMPPDVRSRAIAEGVAARELAGVQELISTIGRRLQSAGRRGFTLPGHVRHYAELAALADDPAAMAQALEDRVDPLLENGRLEEALTWIRAARRSARLLKGTLAVATDRAARRLELAHRRADDERALERFVERRDALAAFERLVERDEDDERWALHFIGDGGVGKTMLLTHVRARADTRYVTARVDFDYLSPDYPCERPALLLEEFADDLRLHADNPEAQRAFAHFEAEARRLAGVDAEGSAGQAVSESGFRKLLELFADALRQLPQPVILLIDTCEELARLRPDGRVPDNVRFTFEEVLEPLHAQLPNLSVVFCGRRTLAYAGGGWQPEPVAGELPRRQPDRRYLRLHELRGFDQYEAETYLGDRSPVRSELVEAILERARDDKTDATSPRFRWVDPSEAPKDTTRYRPFELNRLAAWARADPDLTPERIREERNDGAYAATRIVQRIHHDVLRELLPGMALLGRFDRRQLALAWGGSEQDPAFLSAAGELAELEWIRRDARTEFFMLERGLQESLLAWAEKTVRGALDDARRRLVSGLWTWTTDPDQRSPLAYFEAELRLLDRQPERALEWWGIVEARLTDNASLAWLARLCEITLAREDLAPRLRAAALATLAAAKLQTAPGPQLGTAWLEAEIALGSDPGVPPASRARALAGQVAASRYGPPPEPVRLRALADAWRDVPDDARDERLLAAMTAAAEAALEHAERGVGPARAEGLGPLFVSLRPSGPPEIASFLWTLAARYHCLVDDVDDAHRAYERALSEAPAPGPTTRRWLDWRAPDDVGSRVRLEYAASPAFASTEVLARLGATLPSQTRTVEARFLCAMLLERIRAVRLPTRSEIDTLTRALEDVPLDAVTCHAHETAGPLFAAVAVAMAETGAVSRGLELLESHSRRADSLEDGGAAARDADRASLKIARGMRLADERPWRTLESATSPELEDFAALTVLDGLAGRRRVRRFSWVTVPDAPVNDEEWAAWRHAHWRALYAVPADLGEAAVHWAATALAHERHGGGLAPARAACRLDAHEANLLADRLHLPSPCPTFAAERFRPQEITDPLERLRLTLRRFALTSSDPDESIRPDVDLVGERAAGLLALDEGELLALRLPKQAVRLLRFAVDRLAGCGDPVGMFVAGTAGAIAAAQAGDDEAARQLIDAAADEGVIQSVEQLAAREWTWRPWLVRHLACRAWLAESGRARQLRAVEGWVEDHYGSPPGPLPKLVLTPPAEARPVAVPAELEGWTAEPRRLRAPTPATPGPIAALLPAFVSIALLLAGIVIVGQRGLSGPAAYAVGLLALLAYLLAVWVVWRVSIVRAINRVPPVVDLVPVEQSVKGLRAGPQVAFVILRRRSLPLGLRPRRDIVGVASTEHDLAALGRIAVRLRRLRRVAGGRTLPLRLRVERSVAEGPWDGILASALGETGRDGFAFELSRTTEREGSLAVAEGPLTVVTFSADFAEDDMARRGWSGKPHRFGEPSESGAQALHLIGTPVETRSGWRLDIAAAASRWSLDAREQVRALEIMRLVKRQRVCVLQATPVDRSHGLPHEREQAAGLRGLAGDLYSLGVEVVVTIPPLSAGLGTLVLARLAATLRDEKKLVERLPSAVAAARADVLASPDVEPAARHAVAFDICIYVRLDSDARLARQVTVGNLRSR